MTNFFSKKPKLTVPFCRKCKSKQKMSLHYNQISNRSGHKWVRRIACDVISYNKIPVVFKTFIQTTLLEYANKEKIVIQQIINLSSKK